jgi:phospholipase C
MTRAPLRPLAPALFVSLAPLALAACAGNSVPSPSSTPAPQGARAAQIPAAKSPQSKKIKHVIVIVQENRSFDNMFQGYPGANTASSGLNSKGQTIQLQPIPLEANYTLFHVSKDFFAACDGNPPGENCKMDAFDQETAAGQNIPKNPEYGYVPASESTLYFDMAGQYVLADDMFTSHIDASFVSHQYIIAGQANSAVDLPLDQWGCGGTPSDTVQTLTGSRGYGPSESPCFDSPTIGSELDAKNLTWRYYAAASSDPQSYVWSAYQAISSVYNGPEWTTNVISPPQQFLSDVAAGTLANVTWITPTCANSDHLGCQSNTGPQWVASLVNAVGESKFWKTSTIFVMWDEWGGWYDHVPPPYEDYDGLGIRVPLLMISPYAADGYVSHVQYEHGSILRYIEDTFGLPRLAASDTRANSPGDDASFDFKQKPRKFTPFQTQMKVQDFIKARPDPRPPDEE